MGAADTARATLRAGRRKALGNRGIATRMAWTRARMVGSQIEGLTMGIKTETTDLLLAARCALSHGLGAVVGGS
jgi:hypothetical protein